MNSTSHSEVNEGIVRAYFAARTRGEVAIEYLHPEFVRHSPPPLRGIAAYLEWLSALGRMWGEEAWTILDISASESRVWVRLRNDSTHIGEWNGLPATGQRVSFETINILGIEDGLIRELWRVADDWSRVRQLGGSIAWPLA